jgi:hypothetical protein
MVLHPRNGRVEVYVVSEGIRLKEYRNANYNGQSRRPVRYIEAVSGAPYKIYVENPPILSHSIRVKFKVDGVSATGEFMLKEDDRFSCSRDDCISRYNGQDVFQAFRFSQLVTGKHYIRCSALCQTLLTL